MTKIKIDPKLEKKLDRAIDRLGIEYGKACMQKAFFDALDKIDELESQVATLKIHDEYRYKMIQLLDRKITNLEKRLSKYEKRNNPAKRSGK